MIEKFFRLGVRHMIRQKAYVFINILGLAVGITSFILIGLFVLHELSYDRFHEKGDRIYNLVLDGKIGEQEVMGSFTSAPMAPTFREEIPEIVDAVRMDHWSVVLRIDDRSYVEEDFLLADSTFFHIFSIPLLRGNIDDVLDAPRKLVLTQSGARKYFGEEDPVGRLIYVGTDTIPYEVTGLCEDVPENSHFTFNALASFVTSSRANNTDWFSNSFPAYVLLAEGASAEVVQEKISEVMVRHMGPQIEQVMGITLDDFLASGGRYGIRLQPLKDIHLNPDILTGFKPSNDRKYIYIFSLVAILIIAIAIINYMNLATARSAGRAHEVGIRKVLGSSRRLLVWQFLTESVLMSLLAMGVALVLVELLIPFFNQLMQIDLTLPYLGNPYTIPGLVLLALLVGLLSGYYPAFYLSSFRPLAVLSGNLKRGAKSGRLRGLLVISQMVISLAIILCTLVISRQLHYMLNKDLGFDREHLIVVQNMNALERRIPVFREQVSRIPGVVACSHSTAVPGHPNNNNGYTIVGRPSEEMILMTTAWVDPYHFETYGFELAEGRFFSEEMPSDSFACVINESAVRQFGLEEPLQTRFQQPYDLEGRKISQVIGVVKDFHFASLHEPIQPHVFRFAGPDSYWGYLTVRVKAEDYQRVVRDLETIWKEFSHNMPLQYFFMDDDFNRLYREEQRTRNLALAFAILAIFIASLGLFGLSAFTAEQRTREIGIRKSLGASPTVIMVMLIREVAVLIGLATLIAWPVGYYFLRNWLNNFSYRISLSVFDFLISLLVVLIVSWITISYRSWQASRTNPAMALRHQ
ncbi:MAG TPA: ABC transporter permease [Bacteroidetes bacterium]|nr:ABC transporter permease [Bacteroidota bacterium]